MGVKEAREKLALAKKQLGRVQTASWDPQEAEEAVTWAFYAYENAVVAAAEKLGEEWQKTHPSKVQVAKRLHKKGRLSVNIASKLETLNGLRKDVAYGEPGPLLSEVNLEDLAIELEQFIDEVESLVESDGGNDQ